jgi:hypothetical protein
MAGYKSLQVADALQRINASLAPKVTTTSINDTNFANNYTVQDPTLQAQKIINTARPQDTDRSLGQYAQDAALSLGKGIVSVPEALVGLVDLADTGLQAGQKVSQQALAAIGLSPEANWDIQGGRVTKALKDVGLDFADTKQIATEHMSAPGLQQLSELGALPGMSTQKSIADNLSSLGQTASYALQNPALVGNTIIESLPQIAAGGAIGRGAAALGAKTAAGAIGEGVTMAGAAQANMDRNAEGYTTAAQALGALGIGVLGGAVGLVGGKVAGQHGAQDINNLAAGITAQGANKGFKSLSVGTATEAAEEAAQSSLENVIANVSSGKDAIQGLNQDLVLGTLAGAGMGAGTNAKASIASSALQALQGAVDKQVQRAKEKISREAPEQTNTPTEEFTNPNSASYNPSAAMVREAQKLNDAKTPEEQLDIRNKVDSIMQEQEQYLASLVETKNLVDNIDNLKASIANGEAAIQRVAETKPERAQQIQNVVDGLKAQLSEAEKYVGNEQALTDHIANVQAKVEQAREVHTQYDSLMKRATSQDATMDTQIFGAPQNFTPEQIQKAINDPQVPETSKPVLRALADAVVAQNAVKSIDAVNQQVTGKQYDPNYRSTPQYLAQFTRAIKTGNEPQQMNLMREIGAFEQSHVQKAELVNQGLQLAQQGQRVQVIRNQDGSWSINEGQPLTRSQAKKNGAITIHPTPKGLEAAAKLNDYMQAEAKAITATRTAMEQLNGLANPNSQISRASNVSTQGNSQVQQVQAQPTVATANDFQSALDDLNAQDRANYDFQPQRRIEDPRTDTTSASTNGVRPTEASIPTGTQSTVGTESGNTTAQVQTNKSGTTNPVAKAERVASRSVSEDAATEVQTSTEQATKATNEEATQEVVTPETKQEAEPQDIHDAEKADKNPERTAERKKEPKQRNLVVDGFNKRDTVLNRNENFASRFLSRSNNVAAVESIVGETLTPKQKQAVNDFAKFASYFDSKLDGLIGDKQLEYRFQDFNQFLLEDGSLPENVKTAVSAAMYSWIAENGSKTLNTERDVAGLLLVNDVDNIPTNVFSALTGVGAHQSVVTGSLGQKAVEALGLKVVSDVDPARKQKLEQALGTLAAVALTQNGYLTRTTIPAAQFEAMQKAALDGNDKATLGNQSIRDGKTLGFLVPTKGKKVDQVINSAKETKGIIQNMFGVQRDIKLPSLEPVTTTPHTFNRMGSQLPSYTKDMLEAAQKNGYKMSIPAMQFIDNVKREDLRELFGYVNPNADGASFDGMHKKFWEGQLAANQAVERAIDIIAEQRANLGDDSKEFFFAHTSWTNTRSGYDAAFNLQANKMHRAVAGMSAHVTDVGIEAPIKNGETTKFGEFLMAVAMTAEKIDIGLSTVDKVSAETYLPKFQEYLAQEHVQQGIESMAAILEGQGTKSDMDNVKALTAEFGMGAMSVRGIQALAQMHIAERDGQRTFKSDIAFESDGVTNGPVITNIVLNTAGADMLEAGGVFTDKAKTNVPTNKEQGSQDIYEQLGGVMKSEWSDYKANAKGGQLDSALGLDVIYDAFGERKGAKPIVTTSTYGAGIASIKRANAREVLNAFYKGLEKAGNKNDMQKVQELINAVNATIQYSNFKQKLSTPLAKASGNPLEFLLTPEQESALFYAADSQHGAAIKSTLEKAMSEFNGVRDTLTKQAVAGFKVYELIRNEAINEALKNTDGVIVDGKGNRQEGLSSDEMKKVLKGIARYTPSVVSGMGNQSTNKKQSSIPLMKQDTVWDGSAMSEQQFNFKGSWQAKGNGKFTVRSAIKRDTVADPGVSGLVLIIQSIDAMITHTTIGKIPSQNNHDANASAVGQGKAMAKIQNEAFVDGVMTTHVNREFVRALMNPLTMVLDNQAFYKANKAAVDEAIGEMSLVQAVRDAYARDLAKLDGMKSWENVNQYGTQGGHFEMNAAKRKQIVDQVDQLKADFKKDLALAQRIEDTISTGGNPTTIEDHLRLNGTMKGSDLVPMLQAELKQFQGKDNQVGMFAHFYDNMLDLITKQLPADLSINYFSEADAPSNVNGLDEAIKQGNPAWFTTGTDGKPQINILRSDKPIRAQILVHELVHAITVDSIAQVRKEPTAHPKAAESLSKLDALYEDIKAKVEADPNATDLMKYATQNVEEFIATGFSYPEFVNYLDTQLAPKSARGKNRIVTALRSFVDSILGVLESFTGRKYSAKDTTALEALILDSTEFLGRAPTQTVGTQTSIFGAPTQARNKVNGYTAKEVFDTLPKHANPAFQAHLNLLMTQVADSIYKGLDQNLVDNNNGAWSIEKAWDEYTIAGKAYTTETATTAGFRLSEQEAFAVESLYAALVHGLKDKSMTQVYAEMNKAYNSAKAKLKPESFFDGDWNTATRQDKQDAQDMYDYFFKLGPSNKEHLARFISMALGSEQVNGLLDFAVRDNNKAPTDTFEKLVEASNKVLDHVTGLMTNSHSSQLINNRVALLSKELARIDTKNREHAIGQVESQLEQISDFTDGISKKLRSKIVEITDNAAIANNRNKYVRLAGNTTRLAAKGDLWTLVDTLKEMNTIDNPNSPLGMMGELINEAANNDSTKNHVEKMLRMTKLNNQMKENIRSATTNNVMSTFEENGKYLTKDHKVAFTKMLRSDVQVLADTYSTAEIAKLYTDGVFLQNETANLIKQLKAKGGDQVMINRAKQLAKYMLTGNASAGMAKNAQLIVSGFNSGEVVDITDPRVDLVDKIATMYAIEYTDKNTRKNLSEVFKRELKNKTNGVDTSIKFHRELAKDAREKLFTDNAVSVAKGYMPEITNPNKEIRIARNEAEAKLLKEQFFREVKTMVKDKSDKTSTTPRLFISDEANLQRIVSGSIEIVSTNRKGTQVNMNTQEFSHVINSIKIPTDPTYNPMLDQDVYMMPNYNTLGEVVGFSYEMSGNNRDSLLERNNDFSELLGAYAATNFNKVTVPQQNNSVVDAAYQDYKDNFANNPRAYITVGPNSKEPGLQETWAMLPEATRKHIIKTFGPDGMIVRNDVLLTMFGYRKYSLNQAFDKMSDARNMFESIYVDVMNTLFGNKAKLRGVQAERVWQEAVGVMKDIVVIRNVKTLVSNLVSNALLLAAHGVSMSDIAKDTMTSVRAGMQYRKDMANLLAIRQKQRAGVGDFNKLEQEALRIEDSINRNPLKDFIEEGMMPTIVEDLDPSNNHYSYKSKMQERVDSLTENVPESIKTAAKWAMVSPDTPLYKFLNNATQFSDFSSKYVMYKYYTTKAKEKLSHDDALQIAQDNFINYDIPTSRGLQYLNDMGIVMFTKYNVRIQKALFQLMKKRPASVMAQSLAIGLLTNAQTAIDPIIFGNIGNPIRSGALGLPSALDEPLPIKLLTGL